jgi:two-component system alkaline phosphatase synthesis response regulator PhoP
MHGQDNAARILLVEDEDTLRSTLKLNFKLEGYDVTTAARGSEALARIRGARFDLLVLDVMLPDVDGFAICETIRLEGNTTPVLFLTARNTGADRVRGLRLGDDHLGKPFELEELLLRVRKLLVRAQPEQAPAVAEVYRFGANSIDFRGFSVVDKNGVNRVLSKRETLLLKLLVERSGEVVSREEILQKVWGYDVFPSTRTIDNFILAFRKYFEPDPKVPRHFHSVRGVGYRFTP